MSYSITIIFLPQKYKNIRTCLFFAHLVLRKCRQAYPHHLPPFPAGRVFTGAACGGGSPMRKGCVLCYALLCYAMCTKVHFLCIYGRFLQHLRWFLQHFPAAQPGGAWCGGTVPGSASTPASGAWKATARGLKGLRRKHKRGRCVKSPWTLSKCYILGADYAE